ncbi:hypothetical protein G7054_g4505 [Neopestalotiopsis clavispora]|nr:hypothetical protein G7054_g4505 [Neopestalotiopsis clavispora]
MATPEARVSAHSQDVRWLSYKFDRYREDGTAPPRAPTVGEHGKWELPVPKEFRHGLRPAQGPVEWKPIVAPARAPADIEHKINTVGLHKQERHVWRHLQNVHSWFHHDNVEYQRLLDYGDHNLAMLYSFDDKKGNSRDFVLKIGRHKPLNDPRIRRERRMLQKVRRSQHIVRMYNPEDLGLTVSPGPRLEFDKVDDSDPPLSDSGDDSPSDEEPTPKRRRQDYTKTQLKRKKKQIEAAYWKRTDRLSIAGRTPVHDATVAPMGRRDFILLEYMSNGNLESFIARLNEADEKCPNRVLWSFWVCLIRACIAMAYPVHRHNRKRNNAKFTGALSEMVPGKAVRRKKIRPFVHFAIEPKNVLIGHIPSDVTHDEHSDEVTPILKLAGFGQSEVVKEQRRNWYYERRRTCGTHGYYAPEQFTELWDTFAPNMDGDEICEQHLAGNYGPAMNVWGIALTLLCVITRSEPMLPPRAATAKILARKGDKKSGWWNHYTYGAMLVKDPKNARWSYVDEELREVLAKCLARDPAHRPDLQTLLDVALAKCEDDGPYVYADGETAATNDFVFKWMRTLLEHTTAGVTTKP